MGLLRQYQYVSFSPAFSSSLFLFKASKLVSFLNRILHLAGHFHALSLAFQDELAARRVWE